MRKSRVKAATLLLIHPVVHRYSIKKATEQQVSFYLVFLQCIYHMCYTVHCICYVRSPTALDPCCTKVQPGDVRGWGMTAWLIYSYFAWWSLCLQHILLMEWDLKSSCSFFLFPLLSSLWKALMFFLFFFPSVTCGISCSSLLIRSGGPLLKQQKCPSLSGFPNYS